MDINKALAAFAALSQATRIEIFRLLIQSGTDGLSAGTIATRLNVKQNTLSANLSVLLRAGLIKNQRQGRSIIYYADMDGLRNLLSFLLQDCCGGKSELCQPLINKITIAC